MKIKNYIYIQSDEHDDNISENKKEILQRINLFDQYIEIEEFNKLYNKMKLKIIYEKNKDNITKLRSEKEVFCKICQKNVQENTYIKSHQLTKKHLSNERKNI
jgi:hypothetical protein